MQRLILFLLCILSVRVSLAEDAAATRIHRQIESTPMTQKVTLSDDQWRKILTPGQFQVLREAKTEPPYTISIGTITKKEFISVPRAEISSLARRQNLNPAPGGQVSMHRWPKTKSPKKPIPVLA
jgi:hypothetical protein